MGKTSIVVAGRLPERMHHRLATLGTKPSIWGSGEWKTMEFSRPAHPAELVRVLEALRGEIEAPILATYLQDSDFAFVVAVNGDGLQAQLVINGRSASDYQEGQWVIERGMPEGPGSEWMESAADRFARWSAELPQPMSRERVLGLVEREWPIGDDVLNLILQELGLPLPGVQATAFGGALLLFDGGTLGYQGRDIDLEGARFVMGYGADFVGLWDREAPEFPSDTFPRTKEGELAAIARLVELLDSS
jgi:hypothetical protein